MENSDPELSAFIGVYLCSKILEFGSGHFALASSVFICVHLWLNSSHVQIE